MASQHVLLRVDAGPRIGLGHLQRCLSLATALERRGVACAFLICGTAAMRERIEAAGLPLRASSELPLGSEAERALVLETAEQDAAQAVVVDSYYVDADYLAQLRGAGLFVAALDDLALRPFPCQLVVNGSAAADALPYRSSTGDTVFLLGADYALLKPEFWSLPPRRTDARVRKLLVTLGGSDPHNLMPELLSLLAAVAGELCVTAVLGPFFENQAAVEAATSDFRCPPRLVPSPASLRDLMLEADLAVSAGGQTLYELAATGTPTIAVQTADNQAASLQALARLGVIRYIGAAGEPDVLRELQSALDLMVGSPEGRRRMSALGQRLVDGHGAERVAGLLVQRLKAEMTT